MEVWLLETKPEFQLTPRVFAVCDTYERAVAEMGNYSEAARGTMVVKKYNVLT